MRRAQKRQEIARLLAAALELPEIVAAVLAARGIALGGRGQPFFSIPR